MITILEIIVNRFDVINRYVIRNDEAVNDIVLRIGAGLFIRLV